MADLLPVKNLLLRPIFMLVVLVCFGLPACQTTAPDNSAGVAQTTATRTPFQAVSATVVVPPTMPATAAASMTAQPTATNTNIPATASALPTSTLTPEPANTSTPEPEQCSEITGRIEEKETAFQADGTPFNFRVYLPPCFDSRTGAPYPTLYMIHGQTFSDDQWQRLGIAEAADEMISSGNAPPFMIIMPREPNTFADIYLSSFYSDVTDGLVGWVDDQYPTCAQRECRAIGGLSRGGAWALYMGFTRWELFGAVGAHSTPPFNTTPRDFPGWVQQIPPDSLPRVYMDIGRSDPYLSYASAMESQMVDLGVPHEWYLFNGTHNEEYWSEHVDGYLVWYTQPWHNP